MPLLLCWNRYGVAEPEAKSLGSTAGRRPSGHEGDAAAPAAAAGVPLMDGPDRPEEAVPAARGDVGPEPHEGAEHVEAVEDVEWAKDDGEEVAHKLSCAIEAGRALSRVLTERSVARLPTAAPVASPVAEEHDAELELPSHRVQVMFDEGWHDVSDGEAKEVLARVAAGETEFRLQARGAWYAFDFSSVGEAVQINVRTGKRRKLRILDAPGTESLADLPPTPAQEVLDQRRLGPQSKRGGACQAAITKYLEGNQHAQACFREFEKNEVKYCGEWAVFYHSYSFAALLYEVHAAVASVLFRFRSQYGTLPRILVHEFHETPDAATLIQRFNAEFAEHKRDHHPGFRKVGISAMCSLAATGPEACTARVFVSGYSCKDVSFRSVLETVLESCYVPRDALNKVASQIIRLSEKHGLDVSQFGGKPCKSQKAGHLLQIFVKRHLVDHLAYAAAPYGPLDEERMPLSEWCNSDASFNRGQVRLVAHPKFFMRPNSVRLFVASADPTFHRNRGDFQRELCHMIQELAEPSLRERAATGIYGGTLPAWWTAEDQRKLA